MCLEASENLFWVMFVGKLPDAVAILFILAKLHDGSTELNSQQDQCESVRNSFLHRQICRVATGSKLKWHY